MGGAVGAGRDAAAGRPGVALAAAIDARAPRMRRMRSASGGCVAKSEAMPLANRKWLNSAAAGAESRLPAAPAIFSSAPAMPSGLRVYCTALASARYSRCRLTAAWIRRPKK